MLTKDSSLVRFLIVVFPLAFLTLPGAVQAEAYQIPYLRARPRVFSLYFLSTHCEEIGRLALTLMELSRTFSQGNSMLSPPPLTSVCV